ncbi:MAG: sel1 repeat family protein [Burkholderiales bacterium]|jgi:TPR repeat protein|nr:sel1 repeat family protein [Burkholderiales bacterium]
MCAPRIRECVAAAAACLLSLGPYAPDAAARDEGWHAYERGDFAQAARAYEAGAKRGERLAQYNYAMMILRGETPGAAPDAFALLRASAAQDYAQAQFSLGLLYESGALVQKSLADATVWFRRAALQGHVEAQIAIGTQYFLGRGAPKDETEACRWYERAADGGDAGAQYLAASCYEHGYGEWPRDLERALGWYVQAARGGDPAAAAKAKALVRQR